MLTAAREIQGQGTFTFAEWAAPYRELGEFMAGRDRDRGSDR